MLDLRDDSLHFDHIPHLYRAFKKDDQAGDEVVKKILQTKSQSDQKCAGTGEDEFDVETDTCESDEKCEPV